MRGAARPPTIIANRVKADLAIRCADGITLPLPSARRIQSEDVRSTCVISARIATAISAGERAPMFKPTGP